MGYIGGVLDLWIGQKVENYSTSREPLTIRRRAVLHAGNCLILEVLSSNLRRRGPSYMYILKSTVLAGLLFVRLISNEVT
jgi:hypothetical protein